MGGVIYMTDREKNVDSLFERKKRELGVQIVGYEFSENKDLHVLAKRESDGTYVGWTSYYTGEDKTSYVDFYNGAYDMNKVQGLKELEIRTGKDLGFFDKAKMDVGNDEIYIIENFDMNADTTRYFDVLGAVNIEYYTDDVYNQLDQIITEQELEPLESDSGMIEILNRDDTVIFNKTKGEVGRVADFELPSYFNSNDMLTKKETEYVIDDFYEKCTRFWKNEQKIGNEFALEHNPNELAVRDIDSLERDPNEPQGKLFNEEVKEGWLAQKNKELEVVKMANQIKTNKHEFER